MNAREDSRKRPESYLLYIVSALVLATVLYIRIRLLTVPLERDEGEFAYMGQLLLKGVAPFTHAYTLKLPGVSIAYAIFMSFFGQTPAGIHLGLLIVNGICIALVYLLGRHLFDRDTALVSAISYAVLSLSEAVCGFFAHATHFVVLFSLAGFLLLLRCRNGNHRILLLCSGLCFGLAITMKQHAAILVCFALLYYLFDDWKQRGLRGKTRLVGSALFLLGTLIPYALIVFWMMRVGVFETFWFWTVQYASAYATAPTLGQGMRAFAVQLFTVAYGQPLLWLLAAVGAVCLARGTVRPADRAFLWGYLLFSLLAICPGLAFRDHYFVMLLPGVAILIGAAIQATGRTSHSGGALTARSLLPLLLFGVAIGVGFIHERHFFFSFSPREVSRASYGKNPFPEALEIAHYLKEHSAPGDQIAVLGSEPEILFYADRVSATGQIYMYGLMEKHPYAGQMQQRMIREIEAAAPKYLVVVNVATSWVLGTSLHGPVLAWSEDYVSRLYEQVGVADIIDFNTTRYLWDAKAAGYSPVSNAFVTVYKRKDLRKVY